MMWQVLSSWVNRYLGDEEAVLLALLLIAASLAVLALGDVLAPFLVALVVAFLLQGGVARLCRRKVPRLAAVIIMFALWVGAFFAMLLFIVPLVGRQASNLVAQIPRMLSQWRDTLSLLPEKYPEFISEKQLSELISYASAEAGQFAERALSFSVSSFPNVVAIMVYSILVPLLIFFMLKDKDELLALLSSLLPSERPVMRRIGVEMNEQMANYVRGKAIEIVVVGVTTYLAFIVLGIQYAALLALLVGLSVVVPYIGAAVVTVPVAMVGYFQWGWTAPFFWLMFVYSVIQALDGNVLVPLLFSEAVNLHPIAIILSVLVFGGLWGFWGVFFAIPLATLVKALYNAWPRTDDPVSMSE
ncbi:MAG: AI-2E family transporter [Porticoccaceae bacterium]